MVASSSQHVLRDGRLTHRDSQLLQLAVDPRRTPERIRGETSTDQRADVGPRRPTGAVPALPRPEQAEPASVPGDDGGRLDEDERRPPPRPRARATPRAPGPRRSDGGAGGASGSGPAAGAGARGSRGAAPRAIERLTEARRPAKQQTEATSRAYSTPSATSINAPLTTFLVGTVVWSVLLPAFLSLPPPLDAGTGSAQTPQSHASLQPGVSADVQETRRPCDRRRPDARRIICSPRCLPKTFAASLPI